MELFKRERQTDRQTERHGTLLKRIIYIYIYIYSEERGMNIRTYIYIYIYIYIGWSCG